MAAYKNNLGFAEMFALMGKCNEEQEQRLNEIVSRNSWEDYKKLVNEVLGVQLQ